MSICQSFYGYGQDSKIVNLKKHNIKLYFNNHILTETIRVAFSLLEPTISYTRVCLTVKNIIYRFFFLETTKRRDEEFIENIFPFNGAI